MSNITYRMIDASEIDLCRDLCNNLMAYQGTQAAFHPEIFGFMNFENRLKSSFLSAPDRDLMVAFDGDRPIGYVYSTVAITPEAARTAHPPWAKLIGDVQTLTGFFPDWLELPALLGSVNNLYVEPEYRGQKIGHHLFTHAMEWIEGHPGVAHTFIHVSNGNTSGLEFYSRYGFQFSHDTYGGFIQAIYR